MRSQQFLHLRPQSLALPALGIALFGLMLLLPRAGWAQDVLATPSQTTVPDNSDQSQSITNPQSLEPVASPVEDTPLPFLSQPVTQPNSGQAGVMPPDLTKALTQGGVNFERVVKQPTKIIDLPKISDIPTDPGTVQPTNKLMVEAGKIEISPTRLRQFAAGTGIEPDRLLKTCAVQIQGIAAHEGDAISYIRNHNGRSEATYNQDIISITPMISLACPLNKPPVDRGAILRNEGNYIFPLASNECIPPQPIRSRNSTLTVNLTMSDTGSKIVCEYR
jgi:hypothetical protein